MQCIHYRSCPTNEGALSIMRLELSYQKLHDLLVNKLTPYCPYLQPLKDEGKYLSGYHQFTIIAHNILGDYLCKSPL